MGCNSPFGQVARALETDEAAGVMKVLIAPDSERLLGASITGAGRAKLGHL